ncbi:sialate O-acetylesterase [Niabella yanshanensis]|uniref:Sialate O-acetylesterase n=1 Tax=Niabella yanshanensis TaxID=577386 RepID=A0ABZ0W681_9BACT|nr:sialate O-acetylesterase [Niabella yanshanensis]WQD38808.1 sialate O-acetylesterase [Niabella yanshanensis]
MGEVWVCSGQSNMEYRMQRYPTYAQPLKGANLDVLELRKPENASIRVYNRSRNGGRTSWSNANEESLKAASAAGYFFSRTIQEKLNTPIGIITAAVGGTHIEAWTALSDYQRSPIFRPMLEANSGLVDGQMPGAWYDVMIAPLIPFAVKGFLRLEVVEIAGSDHQFHPALAKIRGKNEVLVFHPEIKDPLKVRLGWYETAVPNLVNADQLPVTPFKTGFQGR